MRLLILTQYSYINIFVVINTGFVVINTGFVALFKFKYMKYIYYPPPKTSINI